MDLLRIRRENLTSVQTYAGTFGLLIHEIYGDRDHDFVNVGARKMGPWGDKEPRWSSDEKHRIAAFAGERDAAGAPAPVFTEASRCSDEVEYFARRMSDAELEQYARWTSKRPLLSFAIVLAAIFLIEGAMRLAGF
jgi:hypothetical protein